MTSTAKKLAIKYLNKSLNVWSHVFVNHDTVARMGGDKYVVLLPIIDSANDAYLVASKIVDVVIKPITIGKLSSDTSVIVNLSASVAIAIYPQHGKDEKLLLINADMAMYKAKSNGKNQAKVFDTVILNLNLSLKIRLLKTKSIQRI